MHSKDWKVVPMDPLYVLFLVAAMVTLILTKAVFTLADTIKKPVATKGATQKRIKNAIFWSGILVPFSFISAITAFLFTLAGPELYFIASCVLLVFALLLLLWLVWYHAIFKAFKQPRRVLLKRRDRAM